MPPRKPQKQSIRMAAPDLSVRSAFGGDHTIVDLTIRDLRTRSAAMKAFREMRDHSSAVGSGLFAIESILRGVKWTVEPGDKTDGEQRRAETIAGMMDDMETSWEDVVAEILQFLVFGFNVTEVVRKVRRGPDERDHRYRSRYTDGLVGWRRWISVDPETITDWLWANGNDGPLAGFVQSAPPYYRERQIPLSKCLHFKTREANGNPEGRSLLVNAYLPWVFCKRIMEFEAIGVERDLAGIPYAGVPPELLDPNATDEDKATLEAIKNIVTGVRQNSQSGIIFPLAYDPDGDGHPMYEFKLLTSGGMKQFQTGDIVERYEARQLMALLADFILLGHSSSGNRALSEEKTGLILRALVAILKNIAGVINRHEIPKLYRLNGWDAKSPCRLVPASPASADLKNLGVFARNLAVAGLLTPDPDLEAALREIADLPKQDPEYILGPDEIPGDSDEPDDEPDDDEPPDNNGKDMGPKPKSVAMEAALEALE